MGHREEFRASEAKKSEMKEPANIELGNKEPVNSRVARDVAQFLHSLVERNASLHTIKAYRESLEEFAEYISASTRAAGRGEKSSSTPTTAKAAVAGGPGFHPSAQTRRAWDPAWEAVDHVRRRLLRICTTRTGEGFGGAGAGGGAFAVQVSGARKAGEQDRRCWWLAKLPEDARGCPTIEEMNRVLDAATPEEAAFRERDKLIFELLYGCGVAAEELVGINLEHISWNQQGIMVRGKGKKERLVPFGDSAELALRDYLRARSRVLEKVRKATPAIHEKPAGNPLILNLRGERLSTRSVGRIVKSDGGGQWGFVAGGASAHAAACVWNASAGRGRGLAVDPGVAGTRAAGDDAAVYAALNSAR